MTEKTGPGAGASAAPSAFYNHPRVRGWIIQFAVLVLLGWMLTPVAVRVFGYLTSGTAAGSFDFLKQQAGFAVSQSLVDYSESSSYWRALYVGLLNTLLVAAAGIVLATVIGLLVGVARLSRNWVISKLAYWYVEVLRNLPLLFQILFWYLGVLGILPDARNSKVLFGAFFFNQRGVTIPKPVFADGFGYVVIAFFLALVLTFAMRRWARIRQAATGQQFPVGWTSLGLIVGLPLVVFLAMGHPLSFEFAEAGRFRLQGGLNIIPELIALILALSTYTASFIAEIVRSGIQAVSYGQSEAGRALGLKEGRILSLIVIPQALRVMIPPLTGQYLNITKNSSLAVAIGYPDLVSVGGTILNQSGQSFAIIGLWMAIYLSISILTSLFMNWYNARIALVER